MAKQGIQQRLAELEFIKGIVEDRQKAWNFIDKAIRWSPLFIIFNAVMLYLMLR